MRTASIATWKHSNPTAILRSDAISGDSGSSETPISTTPARTIPSMVW